MPEVRLATFAIAEGLDLYELRAGPEAGMSYLDDDLRRMAEDYVRRQCSYMGAMPTEEQITQATRQVYKVLKELEVAKKRAQKARRP